MSDRIVIMNNGVIQQDGDPNGIYHHPVNTFVARFIGESNFFDLDGVTYALRPEN